jgi:hypothetical protein
LPKANSSSEPFNLKAQAGFSRTGPQDFVASLAPNAKKARPVGKLLKRERVSCR